ncbi:golvesin C-terminal-like domain-containing protein [Streptomyces parvus]|uniref:golvesin C-terminal-like domain-containing protein n=1 Tax=Streptomyces parvus TaxID=66428 RepID=UPI003821C9EC
MVIAATAVLGGLVQATAWADESGPDKPAGKKPSAQKAHKKQPDTVPPAERAAVLGKDYKKSGDLAWTTTSDAQGFHLLTAREKDGYTWQTTASLSEPGFDTDAWIGNACVTGSGKRAVVVYAPRTFTNKPELMARGAFTAVVELNTGAVTKLPLQASLSYYNPGCGVGESAVLTQSGGEDKAATRLIKLDAATSRLSKPIVTKGQVTSSVVTKDGAIVGASGPRIVKVDTKGAKTALVSTDAVPYRLTPDAEGGLVFLDQKSTTAQGEGKRRTRAATEDQVASTEAKRLTAGQIGTPRAKKTKPTLLAEGPLTETGLTGSAGTVYLTGKTRTVAGTKLPKTVRQLAKAPKHAKVSTRGGAVLTETAWADGQGALITSGKDDSPRPVTIRMTLRESSGSASFTVDPDKRPSPRIDEGKERTPVLGTSGSKGGKTPPAETAVQSGSGGMSTQLGGTRLLATGDRHEVVESERVCSVPRNDPRNQAMQPKPRQVEWAVNQAIRGELDRHATRHANWKNLGMPVYSPQSLFPRMPLEGGGPGDTVPAQVMLGVTAQESNMWQASRVAVPGVTGNPLIGNYYGIDYYDGDTSNEWDIDWSEADCGYGITQVTDHMRMAGREDGKGGAAWDYQKQRAVALDYAANVAAGLQILIDKWNTTRKAGLQINNGDPAKLENWTFALWAYNSGFYPNKGDGSPWGVGWANNPANPEWDAGRTPFMEDFYGTEEASDAAHPQDWPYQEKVLGFAAHPPSYLESPGKMVPAFRAAWWNGTEGTAKVEGSAKYNRAQVKPPENTFCTAGNGCDPGKIGDGTQNEAGAGPCTRSDFTCWWHLPVEWKDDCDYSCGNDFTRFPTSWAEEPDGTAYPPNCSTSGLPSNAMIIDDLPEGTPVVRSGCSNAGWTNQGSFSFDFGDGESGSHPTTSYTKWPAKVDLHQLGAGFGSHFYFGHTRKDDSKGNRLKFTGTWTLNKDVNGPAKVMVHLPDHGAHTKYATYKIHTAKGVKTRIVAQKGDKNRWATLGAFMFSGKPKVTLSTITPDGTGDEDIAFDAVAVSPVDGKFVERNLTAAAIFDPNQDLDSNMPAELKTPLRTMSTLYDWAMGHAKSGPDWQNPEADHYGITWRARCPTATPRGECSGQKTYDAAEQWAKDIKAGGKQPRADGSAPAMSIPVWMAMSNQRPDPSQPASVALKGDDSYKIRSDVEVSFIVDNSTGKIVSGSESASYRARVGNAHLPHFVTNIMKAVEADYGITAPYIDYTTYDALEYGRNQRVHPYTDGDTPGQAYFPHLRGARLNADNTCVDIRAIGGGVHGYRPMVANKYINDNVKAWVDKVKAHPEMNKGIADFAGDVYSMFFKNDGSNNIFGSQIGNAPPIWQDIAAAFCTDGSVKPAHKADNRDANPSNGIVFQSYMPDLYLYIDDKMTDNLGRPSTRRIQGGDWRNFSNMPVGKGHAYGQCDALERGSGGNPWHLDPPIPLIGDGPGERPNGVTHCDSDLWEFKENYTP